MAVVINYTAAGGGGGGGGGGSFASLTGVPSDNTALNTALNQKLSDGIPFSATTAVATAPSPTGTFTPVSSTAPPGDFTVLVCTSNAGNFPAAIDGITGMALNDSLEYSPAQGVWVLNKAKLAVADLSDAVSVALLNSSQQTEVAGGATTALLNTGKTALKDPAGGSDIIFAPLNSTQGTQISGGATTAVLNSGKTALKDPAGGSDIPLSAETHVANYTPSATQTGVSTESATLMSLSLPILPAGANLEIRAALTGNSDAGTTTLRLKFGSTTIATFVNAGSQTINTITASMDCVGSASQFLTGEMRASSTSPDVESNNTSVDTSSAVTLNATLQNSTTTRTSQIAYISVRIRLT